MGGLGAGAGVAVSASVSLCFDDFCFFTFCCPERLCDPGVSGVSVGVPAMRNSFRQNAIQ